MNRVYLLDDHHIVRDGLRSVLQAAGYEVVGESAGTAGVIEKLEELKVDVLILDLHLKDESGIEILQKIQAASLSTKVLVLSMSSEPRHVSETLRFGAMAYVLKGSASAELFQAISLIQDGIQFLSPQIEPPNSSLSSKGPINPLSILSARELEILKLVVSGRTSASIATELSLSPKTVDTYRSRLMTKLEIKDVPSLVRLSIQCGLIGL